MQMSLVRGFVRPFSSGFVRGLVKNDTAQVSVITGTPHPGETLSSTIAGQWFLNGVTVSGETGFEFVIPWTVEAGDEISQALSNVIVILEATHMVFVMIGQSNAIGMCAFDGGAPHPIGSLQYGRNGADDGVIVATGASMLQHVGATGTNMGPSVGFSAAFAAANPEKTLVFVPAALGATGFSDNTWNPGDSGYLDAVTRTNACMAALVSQGISAKLAGFLWNQGEEDRDVGGLAAINLYESRIDAMIDGMRADIAAASDATPFVSGELLNVRVDGSGSELMMRADMVVGRITTRKSNTGVAFSDGLTGFDSVHFDTASMRTLGERMYSAWVSAVDHIAPGASTNIVYNGGMARAKGWSWATGTAVHGDDKITINPGLVAFQYGICEAASPGVYDVTFTQTGSGLRVQLGTFLSGDTISNANRVGSGNGTYTVRLTSGAYGSYLRFVAGTGVVATVDDVSVVRVS